MGWVNTPFILYVVPSFKILFNMGFFLLPPGVAGGWPVALKNKKKRRGPLFYSP
jgi:hypothetical protein